MAELYENREEYKKILESYLVSSENWGWGMIQHSELDYTFTRKIDIGYEGDIDKLLINHGYKLLGDESDFGMKLFTKHSFGQGFQLALTEDEIDFFFSINLEIKQYLDSILYDLGDLINELEG